MKKVLIFLAEGCEEIEALTVVDLLRRAKVDISCVSISDSIEVTGSHAIKIIADTTIDKADFENADMLVLPGGMPGTLNLEACSPLMAQVKSFDEKGKYIAAICAAPTVFGRAGLLVGKKACCYPGKEDDLKGAEVSFDSVCVDKNIITSRGMGTAIDFALKLIEILVDKNTADTLSKGIVYND